MWSPVHKNWSRSKAALSVATDNANAFSDRPVIDIRCVSADTSAQCFSASSHVFGPWTNNMHSSPILSKSWCGGSHFNGGAGVAGSPTWVIIVKKKKNQHSLLLATISYIAVKLGQRLILITWMTIPGYQNCWSLPLITTTALNRLLQKMNILI